MMGAGDLDRLIVVQRPASSVDNSLGEATTTWVDFHSTKAKRTDVNDTEKLSAGQVEGHIMSRFVLRSCADARTVSASDRLMHDGLIWQISGVKEFSREARHRFIEITASARND